MTQKAGKSKIFLLLFARGCVKLIYAYDGNWRNTQVVKGLPC